MEKKDVAYPPVYIEAFGRRGILVGNQHDLGYRSVGVSLLENHVHR